VDTAAALRAIRAAGDGLDSAVQVQPLRDAAIEGFMKRAHEAEARQDYAAAASAADDALKLAPDAPDLLQYRAEIDIALAQWSEAERLALRSHQLGPKSGSLCARNWQTVVEARTALGDAPTVEAARERLKECRIKPLLRM
jgi:tetratricopeptide (TPR) repeat protein